MRKIGEILLAKGVITEKQLNLAIDRRKNSPKLIGEILVDLGYVSEELITEASASIMGVDVVSLKGVNIHPKLLESIPASIVLKYKILPLYIESSSNNNFLYVVVSKEPDPEIIRQMSKRLNILIRILLTTPTELDKTIEKYYISKPEEVIEGEEVEDISETDFEAITTGDIREQSNSKSELFDDLDSEIVLEGKIENDDAKSRNNKRLNFIDIEEETDLEKIYSNKEKLEKKDLEEITLKDSKASSLNKSDKIKKGYSPNAEFIEEKDEYIPNIEYIDDVESKEMEELEEEFILPDKGSIKEFIDPNVNNVLISEEEEINDWLDKQEKELNENRNVYSQGLDGINEKYISDIIDNFSDSLVKLFKNQDVDKQIVRKFNIFFRDKSPQNLMIMSLIEILLLRNNISLNDYLRVLLDNAKN